MLLYNILFLMVFGMLLFGIVFLCFLKLFFYLEWVLMWGLFFLFD